MKTFARDPAGVGEGMTERFLTLSDGRKIRALEAGDPLGPLVVFLCGGASPASLWLPVQRAVAQQAHTLSYDRAGLGGSDRDHKPRTLPRMTEELLEVIDAVAPQNDELVLVGLSWGGAIARDVAQRIPDRVKALVLVDGSVTAVFDLVAPQGSLAKAVRSLLARVTALTYRIMASPLFLPRVRKKLDAWAAHAKMSPADQAVVARDRAAALTGVAKEMHGISRSTELLREVEKRGIAPHIAVTYIKAGLLPKTNSDKAREKMRRVEERHRQVATTLTAEHPLGRYVLAARSEHNIPFFEPELVIDEICRVLG